MTDNEIIKGLNCCVLPTTDCANCPAYVRGDGDCFDKVKQGALDIINRQKAEIEKLKSKFSPFNVGDRLIVTELLDNTETEYQGLKTVLYSGVNFLICMTDGRTYSFMNF